MMIQYNNNKMTMNMNYLSKVLHSYTKWYWHNANLSQNLTQDKVFQYNISGKHVLKCITGGAGKGIRTISAWGLLLSILFV